MADWRNMPTILPDGRVDVFVAHAADAKDFGRRLAARLTAAGLTVFFDERSLEAGTPFDPAIERAVKSCRAFLFVASQGSTGATAYSLTELGWAEESRRKIFTLLAEGHDDVVLPPELDPFVTIGTRGDRIAQAVSLLRGSLRRRVHPTAIAGLICFLVLPAWFLRQRLLGPRPYELLVSGAVQRAEKSLSLVDSREFQTGDTFHLTVEATESVTVYVAYCDAQGHLAVTPASGARLSPGETLQLPHGADFSIDPILGVERLYVISSASPLSDVDASLAKVLERAGPTPSACAPELEMTTDESVAVQTGTPASMPRPSRGAELEYRVRGIALVGKQGQLVSQSDVHGVVVQAIKRPHER
jgi:TIR domain